ncbi:DUF4157 domain-containing protein [Bradyrhizobium sp. 26S5]|uniref:eCIS core domain-containing protein n=1 Tax=Bradyrhizobium sp. 26S5 TaxID=3139729 RepID=UPI0030D21DCE
MSATAVRTDAKLEARQPDPLLRAGAVPVRAGLLRRLSPDMSPADAVALLTEQVNGDNASASRREILSQIQQTYGNRYASIVIAELRAREAGKTGRSTAEPPAHKASQGAGGPTKVQAAVSRMIDSGAHTPVVVSRQPAASNHLASSGTAAFAACASLHASPSSIAVPSATSIARVPEHGQVGGGSGSLKISSPHDPAEREATAVAAQVMRSELPAAAQVGGSASVGLQRDAESKGEARAPGETGLVLGAEIARQTSGGSPLPSTVRGFMEPRFGAGFGNLRIHTGSAAAGLSARLGAKAFTVGQHVFFGHNQYQPDSTGGRELIAHELTHTMQQGAAVRRQDGLPAIPGLSDVLPSADTLAMTAIRTAAPALEPVIRGGASGFTEWLKDRAASAVEGMFTAVMAPVRTITGAGQQLSARFAPMLEEVQTAAAQIAQNDCTPLRSAAEKLEKTAGRLITPIVETLQPVVVAIKGFLSGVWDKFGSPIWEWIKQYAADQWEMIKNVAGLVQSAAKWLWDNTSAIRAVYAEAWNWLKNKLGIGEGPEGQDGILQWVEGKLDAAWSAIKVKLEPFKAELTAIGLAVGGVALALSPAGPIMAVGGAIVGIVQGLRWIHANWGKGNIIVQARTYIEATLIPPLLGAARNLGGAVTGMANSISAALGNLAAGLVRSVGVLGGSLLAFAVSAVQWIADQANALATWASAQLGQIAVWLSEALNGLQAFLTGVMEFLRRVGEVVLDIWGLPVLLAEKIWNWVPACIRDPIVDFLGPIILRQIELFQELAKDSEAWQKTKAEVGRIVRLVFHDHDLMGAIRATFHLILRVFNLPPDLVVTVVQKAETAWDIIVKKPLDFIKNTVRAVGLGFKGIWDDKIENLKLGLQGWLLGQIEEKNIVVPTNWSEPRQLFEFVLSVLGLSVDHVYELLKTRFPGPAIDKIRSTIRKVAGVISWVNEAIDTTRSPRENALGMINQAKDFGKTILTGIAEWVAGKVAEEVAIMAASAAASAGLSEVADVARRIYKAMVAAARYARPILDMVDRALDNVTDLAVGAVGKVGVVFEKILQRGMPVVIGFLAYQVGLGGVGAAIRGIIDALRHKVDAAILWMIDKIKGGLDWLVGAAKAGVEAVTEWWSRSVSFADRKGHPHKIFYSGHGAGARLKIASTEVFTEEFLARIDQIFAADPAAREFGEPKRQSCQNSLRRLEYLKSQLELATRTRSPSLEYLQREHKEEMVRLSAFTRLLMDILPENAATLPVKVGDRVTIPYKETERMGRILATSTQRVQYSVDAVAGQLQISSDEFREKWKAGIIREYVEEGLREKYLGDTPGKADKTGRDLIDIKYKPEKKYEIRDGAPYVEWRPGSWHPLSDCDMSHEPLDAVDYWNNIGRHTGARSEAVRAWMLDYKNYILEPSVENRRRGARAKSKYLPPTR